MPRLQVSLILLLTGLSGFLISYSLLHLGVSWMWLRYPVAIMVAYCVFLLLLRLWLYYQGRRDSVLNVDIDASFAHNSFVETPSHSEVFKFSGRGGDAGGGGAGGSWEEGATPSSMSVSDAGSTSGV
ncbi:MAG: hypothetical protein H0V88_14195, partial [Pyrinomonadaceae bacterium]|nr:hypothetical protein [Pyrinomonadaceae bacterium]